MNPEATLIYQRYIEPMSKTIREYDEINHSIKALTGFDLIALRDLFAMGYTLKRPDHDLTATQLAKITELITIKKVEEKV